MMILGGIQKNSFIDYPGKISCVIFVSGCNFDCPYCHNPSLVDPFRAEKRVVIKERAIMDFLHKRRDLLEGVVISGGEPTLSNGLIPFCKRIKQMGYPIKLDTNGSRPQVLDLLIREGLVDYIAMDIKTAPELYSVFIKRNFEAREILSGIQLIMASGKDYEFRTTCIRPIVNDRIIEKIARIIKGAHLYALQKFVSRDVLRPEFFRGSVAGYNEKELFRLKSIVEPWVRECIVRC